MKTNIGESLKSIRISKNITQVKLSKKLGIDQALYSRIESNKSNPTIQTLEKISQALEVPLGAIFWLGISEESIPKDKKNEFLLAKDQIDGIFNNLYDLK